MFQDRRRVPRKRFNRIARLYNDLAGQRECMLIDFSELGARLYSEIETPPEFTLLVSGEGGNVSRACRVVWRLGNELGVQFTDALPAKSH
jgi:PilZ domain